MKDPVCGMTVDPANSAGQLSYNGTPYYFCSTSCVERFKSEPQKYLVPRFAPISTPGLKYTCPMHPEIVRDGPGSCPICGMTLEPVTITLEEPENAELRDMTRRFWYSVVLTAPILFVAMSEMVPGRPLQHAFSPKALTIFQLMLASPVVLWGGFPFFARAWHSVLRRTPNMFTLIGIGTGVAYFYSLFVTLFPDLLPHVLQDHSGQPAVYFEAAAVITTLVLLGQVLELKARSKTTGAIKALLALAPKVARLIQPDGTEKDIPLEHVKKGDLLRVKPGAHVPVDGVVVEGFSTIDESMLTGEPIPVEKTPGAKVTAGTVNGTGSFVLRAERVGSETVLAQIVRMVGEAQRSRAPIQRLADVVSSYFVPAVLLIALLTFVGWWIFGPNPKIAYAVVNSVAVLIIACPCALGLATPMSIMVGTGKGATCGVLVKNAQALEILEKVGTLIVDKTGTLTIGKPVVTSVHPVSDFTEEQLLIYAAALEKKSEHPLGQAIVHAALQRQLRFADAQEFHYTPGKGLAGKVERYSILLGNDALLAEAGIKVSDSSVDDGSTTILIAVDQKFAGMIRISDQIKETTPEAVQLLHRAGLRIVMVTGDGFAAANTIAKKLNIDEVNAGVLPQEKIQIVRDLQKKGHIVAMAGDGINDAPALSAADVGIAMGSGADVAMESAEITLVKGDLRGIARARNLSRATMRNIRQNLLFAFLYNVLGIPIAAGVLYPFWGLLLNPMIASAAMTFSSVSVIANALRLRKISL
jgi:P-type Cu+ transporter